MPINYMDNSPDAAQNPPSPTSMELNGREWAEDMEKKWTSLGGVLECISDINAKLKHSKQYNLICFTGGNRYQTFGFLLNVMESTTRIQMRSIVDELLARGHEPPEEAKES